MGIRHVSRGELPVLMATPACIGDEVNPKLVPVFLISEDGIILTKSSFDIRIFRAVSTKSQCNLLSL